MSLWARLTPLGMAIIGLLVVAIALTFTGSKTLQIVGFIAVIVLLIVLASDRLRSRLGVLTPPSEPRDP